MSRTFVAGDEIRVELPTVATEVVEDLTGLVDLQTLRPIINGWRWEALWTQRKIRPKEIQ